MNHWPVGTNEQLFVLYTFGTRLEHTVFRDIGKSLDLYSAHIEAPHNVTNYWQMLAVRARIIT
jgi:hypothetical protein